MAAKRKRKSSSSSSSDSDNGQLFYLVWLLGVRLTFFLDVSTVKKLIAVDISLEISLRQRLASTIESRIAWALLLQDSLTKDFHGSHCCFHFPFRKLMRYFKQTGLTIRQISEIQRWRHSERLKLLAISSSTEIKLLSGFLHPSV